MIKLFISNLICFFMLTTFAFASSNKENETKSYIAFQATEFHAPSYNFNTLISKISKKNNFPVVFQSSSKGHMNIAIFNEKLSNTDAICDFAFNPVIKNYLSGIKYISGLDYISTRISSFTDDKYTNDFFNNINPYSLSDSIFGRKNDISYHLNIKIINKIDNFADISFSFKEENNEKHIITGQAKINLDKNEIIIGIDNNILIFSSLAIKEQSFSLEE